MAETEGGHPKGKAAELEQEKQQLLDLIGPKAPKEEISRISRFLWYCAGADAEILERCPHTDRVKKEGVGGTVLATTILAFLSGSYAFYTVFGPKIVGKIDPDFTIGMLGTILVSMVLGVIWALIIFNLDRFIVSSTGYGDGTPDITLGELGRGLPRLFMATIIALCLSAPLEMRILKPELDVEIAKMKLKESDAHFKAGAAVLIKSQEDLKTRLISQQKRIDELKGGWEKRRLEIAAKENQVEEEAEGKSGSGRAGKGIAYDEKKARAARMMSELEQQKGADLDEIKRLEADKTAATVELQKVEQDLAKSHDESDKVGASVDGLLERIHLSHEIGGAVPWMITLLLWVLETGPIFFKMMMVKGVYEWAEENLMFHRLARLGIDHKNHEVDPEKKGQGIKGIFHGPAHLLSEEISKLETAKVLSMEVHQQFVALKTDEIRKDPESFISQPPTV
ncbi:MAG: DUF4407 domain-containing protein [Rhodospirillaceae bacterium]